MRRPLSRTAGNRFSRCDTATSRSWTRSLQRRSATLGCRCSRVEILAALDEAEVDIGAGRYADYTDATLPVLADELKREARSLPERR